MKINIVEPKVNMNVVKNRKVDLEYAVKNVCEDFNFDFITEDE